MTEEEAKKKWCPKAIQPIPTDCGWTGAYNRTEKGEVGSGCFCLGFECMAWRNVLGLWHQERGRFLEVGESYSSGDVVIDKPNGHGYCGLAGRP